LLGDEEDGECHVDGDRRRGWRFGAGGRRPEELQHEDDGGRRIVEDHDGRWSGTELQHEGRDSGEEIWEGVGNGRTGEPSQLLKQLFPSGKVKRGAALSGLPQGGTVAG
jgi:hypothetical protein